MNVKKNILGIDTSEQLHGAVFDWSVMFFSTMLSFVFPSLSDFIHSPYARSIILIALVLFIIGTILKRIPLVTRLELKPRTSKSSWGILIPVQFCIMIVVGYLSAEEIGKITGWYKTGEENPGPIIFISVFLAILTSSLTAWASMSKVRKRYSDEWLRRREMKADIMLIVATSVFTFIFWDLGPESYMKSHPIRDFGVIIPVFIFILMCYVIFYLPFRYLYIIEDGHKKATWRRMWIVLLIVFVRSAIAALS